MLAERTLMTDMQTDSQRIDFVLSRVLGRPATDEERKVLLAALQRSRSEFRSDRAAAGKLVHVGESTRNDSLDIQEHATWTSLCLAVLNFDETLNRE